MAGFFGRSAASAARLGQALGPIAGTPAGEDLRRRIATLPQSGLGGRVGAALNQALGPAPTGATIAAPPAGTAPTTGTAGPGVPTPPVANVGAQMNAAQAAAARARRRARGPLMGTVGQAVPTGTAGTRTLLGGY